MRVVQIFPLYNISQSDLYRKVCEETRIDEVVIKIEQASDDFRVGYAIFPSDPETYKAADILDGITLNDYRLKTRITVLTEETFGILLKSQVPRQFMEYSDTRTSRHDDHWRGEAEKMDEDDKYGYERKDKREKRSESRSSSSRKGEKDRSSRNRSDLPSSSLDHNGTKSYSSEKRSTSADSRSSERRSSHRKSSHEYSDSDSYSDEKPERKRSKHRHHHHHHRHHHRK